LGASATWISSWPGKSMKFLARNGCSPFLGHGFSDRN
jgi:hypothetical protein